MTIELDGVTKRYGAHTAVDEISLIVEPAETYALLGPNGAGKTTTVEMMEGLRVPDAGSVRVLGLDPIADRRTVHSRIGVMLQEGGLYPGARPTEILELFSSFHSDPRPSDELLALVDLQDRARTLLRRLSGGEKQRLSLALALVGRPEVLFLDEPTAGMDPVARRSTWSIIERLQGEGVTILLTTHYMEEAERLAGRVGILHRGRLIAEGTPHDLIHRQGSVTVRTSAPVDAAELGDVVGATTRLLADGSYLVDADSLSPQALVALATWLAEAGVEVEELRQGAAGLEDVFLGLTGQGDS